MQYMVRVEIHGADRETYERLHAAMAVESMSRILTDDKSGKTFHAPIGTYWAESAGDASSVFQAAKRAAFPIDPRAEIMISAAGPITFFGCPEVLPEPSYLADFGALFAQSLAAAPYGRLTGLVPGSGEPNYPDALSALAALMTTPIKG
jgi:hypothetical protein